MGGTKTSQAIQNPGPLDHRVARPSVGLVKEVVGSGVGEDRSAVTEPKADLVAEAARLFGVGGHQHDRGRPILTERSDQGRPSCADRADGKRISAFLTRAQGSQQRWIHLAAA